MPPEGSSIKSSNVCKMQNKWTKREQLGWGVSKWPTELWKSSRLAEGLLKVFLIESLLILPFLPEPQILSNLPFLVQQNPFRPYSTPGGNHECYLVYLELPENAPSRITLLQHALHSSLCRSGDKGQGEKLQRSNYLKPHIQPCPNLIRFLSCHLTYFFCTYSPAQQAFRIKVLTLWYGIQKPLRSGPSDLSSLPY